MNVQMRIITADNVDEVTSMKNSDNIIKLTGLNSLDDIIKNTSEKLIADNEKHLQLKRERENNILEEEEEKRNKEYGRDELAPPPPSPDMFLANDIRFPVGAKVYLEGDSQGSRIWTVIEELFAGEEGKYLYIIRTSPPDQIYQLTVKGSQLTQVLPSPPVQGLAPDSPSPISPDYDPNMPSTEQLQEDDYDYDTEDEFGFYDPGPANLDEIVKQYEESRQIIREEEASKKLNELPSTSDENFTDELRLKRINTILNKQYELKRQEEEEEKEEETSPGVDTYMPQQRTVIEKDFNEGLNLLATDDDEGGDENNSGDEDDGDRKSVTA